MPQRRPASSVAKILGTIALIAIGAVVTYVQSRAPSGAPGSVPQTSESAGAGTLPASKVGQTPPAEGRSPDGRPAAQRTDRPSAGADKPSVATRPPGGTVRDVRVGAWNIEWLGKPEDRSGAGKSVAQDPNDLAEYIIASKVAVLGVCEIVTSVAGRPIRSREIERTIERIRTKTGDRWSYVLYPGRADGDQLTGVMWNTGIATAVSPDGRPMPADAPVLTPVPVQKGRSSQGSSLWNRPPHALKLSFGDGMTDIVLIVVHMKADYQGDFAAHRKQEADALITALPTVKKTFGDSDILIIGDSNCVELREPAMQAFERAGFVDLNASGRQTHWRGGTMDRGFVPVDQPEFKSRAFDVLAESYLQSRAIDPRMFKERFSDHYLVYTTISVMNDDD